MTDLAPLEQQYSDLLRSFESFSKDVRNDIKNLQKLITVSEVSKVHITHIKEDQNRFKEQLEEFGVRLRKIENSTAITKSKTSNNEWVIRTVIVAVVGVASYLVRGLFK